MRPSERGSARLRRARSPNEAVAAARQSADHDVMSRAGRTSSASAQTALRRRRTVLRTTAEPTCLLTMKPKRAGALVIGGVRRRSRCALPAHRRPRRTTALYSAPRVSRFGLASTARGQAESSVRPLARRAERMPRPARVRMRARKPCFLARRRLLGWKVRLVMGSLPDQVSPGRSDRGRRVQGTAVEGISQPIKATSSGPITQTERHGPAIIPNPHSKPWQ